MNELHSRLPNQVFATCCACYFQLPQLKQLAFTIAGDPGIEVGVALYDSSLREEVAMLLRGQDALLSKQNCTQEQAAFCLALAAGKLKIEKPKSK